MYIYIYVFMQKWGDWVLKLQQVPLWILENKKNDKTIKAKHKTTEEKKK